MKFEEVVNYIKSSPKHRIRVTDISNDVNTKLTPCLDFKQVQQEYSSNLANYFIELNRKGVKKVYVELMKEHGNTQVKSGISTKFATQDFILSGGVGANGDDSVTPVNGSQHQIAKHQQSQTYQAQPMPQNFGMSNAMGLSFPQVMDMSTRASKYDEEKARNTALQSKVDALESENKQLTRDNLKYELGIEGKPGALDTLLEKLDGNTIASIISAIGKAKGGTVTPSLNAANENLNADVSPTKRSFIEEIVKKNDITDDTLNHAYQVINLANDETFMTQYIALYSEAYAKLQNPQNTTTNAN